MKIDATAAAYGLFQVVFASMTNELALALFALRSRRDPQFTFEKVPTKFSWMLEELRKELDNLRVSSREKDSLAEVRRMCWIADRLATWRNSRIHARVKWTDEGLVLLNWKTSKRLSITVEECAQKTDAAGRVISNITTHMTYLARDFDSRKNLKAMFRELMSKSV
jgi:hypothetical protein